MELRKVGIIGAGLLGTDFQKISEQNIECYSIKDIRPNQKNIIQEKTDTVIFVAQSADYKKPVLTENLFFVNTILPVDIIKEAYELGVKNFIYCSTGSVYTDSINPHLEKEVINLLSTNPYVTSKIATEILLGSWKEKFEKLIILRPFFMYGKNQSKEQLFSKMIENVKEDSTITLAENKGLIFNPIHVHDASRFVLHILKNCNGYNIFNVAGTEIISLGDVISHITENMGKSAKIVVSADKAKTMVASIDNMKSVGFSHIINIKDGLREMTNV